MQKIIKIYEKLFLTVNLLNISIFGMEIDNPIAKKEYHFPIPIIKELIQLNLKDKQSNQYEMVKELVKYRAVSKSWQNEADSIYKDLLAKDNAKLKELEKADPDHTIWKNMYFSAREGYNSAKAIENNLLVWTHNYLLHEKPCFPGIDKINENLLNHIEYSIFTSPVLLPIHCAFKSNKKDIIKFLSGFKNTQVWRITPGSKTLLFYALKNRNIATAKLLVQRGVPYDNVLIRVCDNCLFFHNGSSIQGVFNNDEFAEFLKEFENKRKKLSIQQ